MFGSEFLAEYWLTFLFYGGLIALIILFRRKFEWHGIIGLYKTKIGIGLMKRIAENRTPERIKLGERIITVLFPLILLLVATLLIHFFVSLPEMLNFGFSMLLLGLLVLYVATLLVLRPIELASRHGVIVGFLGMAAILIVFAKASYDLIFRPEAPPAVSPVLPGTTIPGIGIKIPLVAGWLALFIVIVIHEFSHGVVAKAFKIRVKSSGLLLFGPIGGAFVEPDEKVVPKRPKRQQLGIFAAGPYSNLLTGPVFLVIVIGLSFLASPLLTSTGVTFGGIQEGSGAAEAGVEPGVTYDTLDGEPIPDIVAFTEALEDVEPGDQVTLASSEAGNSHDVTLGPHPEDSSKAYMGVLQPSTAFAHDTLFHKALHAVIEFFSSTFFWVFNLSLGLGLANLLPLGPVDGGRMFHLASEHYFGKKRGRTILYRVSVIVLAVLIILFTAPIIKSFL